MVLQIAYSIRFFLLVLFCVLAGFTQAFWLLSNVDPTNLFGTVKGAFLTAFMYMLGQNVEADFDRTASPKLATFLLIVFMMAMIILMLNLLIALMGDVFSSVRAKGFAVWRKEQASIIIEESFFFADEAKKVPPFLHVLKYTSEVGNSDDPDNNSYKESPLVNLVKQGEANVVKFTPFEINEKENKENSGNEHR
jgi:hypothetical protein